LKRNRRMASAMDSEESDYTMDEYVLDARDTRALWQGGSSEAADPSAADAVGSLVAPGLVMEEDALRAIADQQPMEESKVIFDPGDIALRFEHDSDWSTESNFNSADEDSNDENYYLNDYPDEEDFELDGIGGGGYDEDDGEDDYEYQF